MDNLNRQPVLLRNWNFNPIFNQGLMIHAWGSADNTIIVNIIDPGKHFDSPHNTGSGYVGFGKGPTVDCALLHAMISFYRKLSHDEMYADKKFKLMLPNGYYKTTCRLDGWIAQNQGTMTATKDVDGLILCKLEGFTQSDDLFNNQITLHGSGPTLSIALRKAFQTLSNRLVAVS